MRKISLLLFLLFTLILFLFEAQLLFSEERPKYVAGEVLVKFKKGTSAKRALATHSALGYKFSEQVVQDVQKIKIDPSILVEEAIKNYEKNPDVEFAQPNYIYHAMGIPNDSQFNACWGLHNTGQTVNGSGGTVDADIDAPEAWEITKGEQNSVIVAVLDTGVLLTHEDLSNNVLSNGYDFINNDSNPTDDDGHGTHVSGTIAAVMNNNTGIAGVNPNAKIIPIKVLDSYGQGTTGTTIEGIDYAVGKSAKIMNMSFGGTEIDLLLYEAIDRAKNSGVLVVAAAGNESRNNGTTHSYPSDYELPNIISVAASNQNDSLASLSNYSSQFVHVAAPGTNIYSTLYNTSQSYGFNSGTSMATPHVAGLASLIWSYAPLLTYAEVKNLILQGVDRKDTLTDKVVSGGRINALNSLTLVQTQSVPTGNVEIRAGANGYVDPETGQNASIYFRPGGAGTIEINIYTLSKNLVFSTTKQSIDTSQAVVTWDGRKNSGENVDSGIYIVHIKGPEIDEKKKVAVIK